MGEMAISLWLVSPESSLTHWTFIDNFPYCFPLCTTTSYLRSWFLWYIIGFFVVLGRPLGVLYLIQRCHQWPSQLRWKQNTPGGGLPHCARHTVLPLSWLISPKTFYVIIAWVITHCPQRPKVLLKFWDLSTTNIPFRNEGQKPMFLAYPWK